MATKKKSTKESGIQVTIGSKDPLVGEIVSLNCKESTTFIFGDINLSQKRYWAKVSENMPDVYYRTIRRALDMGILVRGKQYIPNIEKKKEYLDKLRDIMENGTRDELIKEFRHLTTYKLVNGYTIAEVVEFLRDIEIKGKRRKPILDLLIELEKFHEGPHVVVEEPSEEEGKIKDPSKFVF